MSTVRDLVAAMQREIRDAALTPARACELLARLTALIGNCADEIRAADMEYAVCLLGHLEQEEKANRARIKAEISPEYQRKRQARDTHVLVIELVRSLKYVIRATEEEMRLAR